MTDPIADAAAQQQNDPSLLEKAMDTIHSLEAKVEHLMHPEGEQGNAQAAPVTPNSSEASSAPAETSGTVTVESTAGSVVTGSAEVPNVAPAADAGGQDPVGAAPAAGGDEPVNGIVGLVDPAASIRTSIANIKQHLSIRGFELSAVADIHAELAAIERFL